MPRAEAASVDAQDLRIRLLGGFRVCIGPRAVEDAEWRLRKARSLVKLLALTPGHRLHREQAIDLLWPDLDPEAAANNLRQALHVARRALEPAPTVGRCLQLEADLLVLRPLGRLWIDVEAFEAAAAEARRTGNPGALRAALDLYRGDLLPEDRYEDWAASRREELRETYLALLAELAVAHQERGEPERAIEALRRLVAAEPAREEAHVRLMRLYAAGGQRHQAIRQYRQLREALRRELDAEPDPSTQRLYREILAGRISAAREPPIEPAPAAAATPRHNLPSALTSFIGREREIAVVSRLLAEARLLTLSGAGGCGKTRLALETAARLLERFPGGVWLVELAALADPALVPQAVASALGLREEPGRPLTETMADYLRPRRPLLLLDNCEHLRQGCAALAEALLRACPGLRILATSRQPLGLLGEAIWRVPSLPLPAPGSQPAPRDLTRSEAVRLFIDRARLVQPEFSLTGRNGAAVAQVCQQLDGMPLAIELAAARVAVLSVEQIAERLDDRFRLATGGSPTVLRHQTLRAAVDWSYELLSPPEQRLFNRLSVFAGGWTLEAAEAVCASGAPGLAVLDGLASLVDKSLVLAEIDRDGGVRYRLLETLRQYGRERVEESSEAAATREQHAAFFLALAERAEPELHGPRQVEWLNRLEQEHDNLRAALGWSRENRAADIGLRLAGALCWFWNLQGYWSEGRAWSESTVAPDGAQPRTGARAKALWGAGMLTWRQGDYPAARRRLEESIAIGRELGERRIVAHVLMVLRQLVGVEGDHAAARCLVEESAALFHEANDRWGLALTLHDLGCLALEQGDAAGESRLEESVALFREVGDNWGLALALNSLGDLARSRHDYARAAALYEESLALSREMGIRSEIASFLHNLGYVAHRQGDDRRAAALFGESLARFRDAGDKRGVAFCLIGSAGVAGATRQPERAARLLGAAESLLEAIGARIWPSNRADYDRIVAAARAGLDDVAFNAAWEEGRAMSPEQAVEYALNPRG